MAKKAGADMGDLLVQARITNRLLAAQLRSSMRQHELVALLAGTGATAQEIADVLNTTAATVSVTMQRLRQKRRRP